MPARNAVGVRASTGGTACCFSLKLGLPLLVAGGLLLRRLFPMGGVRVAAALGALGGATAGLTLHFTCPIGGGLHVGPGPRRGGGRGRPSGYAAAAPPAAQLTRPAAIRRARQRRTIRWPQPRPPRAAGLLAGGWRSPSARVLALWATLPDVRPLARRRPPPRRSSSCAGSRRKEAGKRFVLRQTWRPVDRISPYLQEAVVLSEDAKFWQHEGVDWDAVEKAAEKNWKKGKVAVGGSTITQQLAKNLYLSPSKNPLRKLRELLIARRLEAELSKERAAGAVPERGRVGGRRVRGRGRRPALVRHERGRAEPRPGGPPGGGPAQPPAARPSARDASLDRKAARLVTALHRRGLLDAAALDQALVQLGTAAAAGPPPDGRRRRRNDAPAVLEDLPPVPEREPSRSRRRSSPGPAEQPPP